MVSVSGSFGLKLINSIRTKGVLFEGHKLSLDQGFFLFEAHKLYEYHGGFFI